MIVAIEIKSTEECPFRTGGGFVQACCNKRCRSFGQPDFCVGLESLDCPMRAIRCETCGQGTEDWGSSDICCGDESDAHYHGGKFFCPHWEPKAKNGQE